MSSAFARRWRPGRRRQVAVVTRQIATLLQAGFTLDRALSTAAALADGAGPVVRDLREQVRGGAPLAAALARHPGYFSEFYRGIVAAGERSGRLVDAFARVADQLDRQADLRGRLAGALLYPAIMAVVGSAAVLMLILYVIPRFAEILGQVGGELPASARALVSISGVVQAGWWIAGLAVVVAVAVAIAHRRSAAGRLAQDLWRLRLPLVGSLAARLATERTARSLAGALAGGIPLLEALSIAGESAANSAFRRELERAADAVRRGEPLAAALRRGGVVPELAVQMIAAGEESGRLAPMLEHVAETYRTETERQLRTLVAMVEPAIIVVFGAAVAFVALALLQTIYGIGLGS